MRTLLYTTIMIATISLGCRSVDKLVDQGQYDDAISNALGSNIFDICFALGFPLFLFTLIYHLFAYFMIVSPNICKLDLIIFTLYNDVNFPVVNNLNRPVTLANERY